jgi:WD40 repeat protein
LTGSGQKAAVGAPKTTLALDEILFSDSASFMNEGHLVADRTAARQLAAMSSRCIAVNMDKDGGGRVISCGYWDNSLKVHSLESNKEIASVNSAHWGNITCVSTGLQNSHILLTGSTDCTVRIWVLEWSSLAQACTGDRVHSQFQLKLAGRDGGSGAGGSSSASGGLGAINTGGAATSMASVVGGGSGIDTESLTCVHVLRGHQKGISAIHYCPELDLVLSGDVSGTMCLHTVRKGRFIRKLYHHQHSGNDEAGQKGSTFSVDQVLVSTAGYLVSYSRSDNQLNVFWVNGDLLTSTLLHNDL